MEQTSVVQPDLSMAWEAVDETSAVLLLRGELELFTEKRVRDLAESLAERGIRRVVIDLSDVSFIDSAGISMVIWLFKRFRGRGAVCLVDPLGRHRQALELVQLTRLVPIFPDREAALAGMPAPR